MGSKRVLYAVEESKDGKGPWELLPNTIFTHKQHAVFDMTNLRKVWPNDKYRIVKYVPESR